MWHWVLWSLSSLFRALISRMLLSTVSWVSKPMMSLTGWMPHCYCILKCAYVYGTYYIHPGQLVNSNIKSMWKSPYCYCLTVHCIMSATYRNCWLWLPGGGGGGGLRLLCNPDTMKESGAIGRVGHRWHTSALWPESMTEAKAAVNSECPPFHSLLMLRQYNQPFLSRVVQI